jgi:hypothetical protein
MEMSVMDIITCPFLSTVPVAVSAMAEMVTLFLD